MESVVYTPLNQKKPNLQGKAILNIQKSGSINLSRTLVERLDLKIGDGVAILKHYNEEDNSFTFYLSKYPEGYVLRKINDTSTGLTFNSRELAQVLIEASGAGKFIRAITLAVFENHEAALGYRIDLCKILKQL